MEKFVLSLRECPEGQARAPEVIVACLPRTRRGRPSRATRISELSCATWLAQSAITPRPKGLPSDQATCEPSSSAWSRPRHRELLGSHRTRHVATALLSTLHSSAGTVNCAVEVPREVFLYTCYCCYAARDCSVDRPLHTT